MISLVEIKRVFILLDANKQLTKEMGANCIPYFVKLLTTIFIAISMWKKWEIEKKDEKMTSRDLYHKDIIKLARISLSTFKTEVVVRFLVIFSGKLIYSVINIENTT